MSRRGSVSLAWRSSPPTALLATADETEDVLASQIDRDGKVSPEFSVDPGELEVQRAAQLEVQRAAQLEVQGAAQLVQRS